MNLTGKTVVVYGAGISGISAAQLVRDHGGRAVIYDDNPTKSHSTSCTSVFNDCDIVVVSPGVPSGNEHVLDARLGGKQVLSELEFASLFCRAEQIAVTAIPESPEALPGPVWLQVTEVNPNTER